MFADSFYVVVIGDNSALVSGHSYLTFFREYYDRTHRLLRPLNIVEISEETFEELKDNYYNNDYIFIGNETE